MCLLGWVGGWGLSQEDPWTQNVTTEEVQHKPAVGLLAFEVESVTGVESSRAD